MKPVSAISIDLAGTLLHPHPSVAQIYAEVSQAYGVILDTPTIENRFYRAFKTVFASLRHNLSEKTERDAWFEVVRLTFQPELSTDLLHPLFNDLFETFADAKRWRTEPHIHDTLASLADRGFLLVVLSNGDQRMRKVLRSLRILSCFKFVFLSSELGFEKPDPKIFQHVSETLRISPQYLLHIGDSLHNDGACRNAGWQFLHYAPSLPPKPDSISHLGQLDSRLHPPPPPETCPSPSRP